MQVVPQIWTDALTASLVRRLSTPSPFAKLIEAWDQEHERKLRDDPEYAKEYEAFEQEWARLGEEWHV